jgi:tripeptide aminopeptidase
VSDVTETIVRRTVELAEVPAPTGSEEERSAIVRSWWDLDGLAEVRVDGAGNVWGRARDGEGPIVILCAHLDTVFDADVPHTVRVDGDLLIGPSVGDDSVAVAALSAAGMALQDGPHPVWVLATVGEEGLGNLRGVIAALDGPPASVAAFVAVEGNYLGRVSTIGVGSVRRRIRVTGPGGHAWEDAEVPSALHHLARVVTSITSSPRRPGTSVNVGRIGGGEGINLRAAEAWFDLDLRADDPDALAALVRAVDEIARQAEPPLVVMQELLGERPAGRIERDHPLVRAAEQALDEAAIPVSTPPTSTDANAAHARGIPAIAVGVTKGSGEHTPHEWIETGPIETGVQTLARTIERFGELST